MSGRDGREVDGGRGLRAAGEPGADRPFRVAVFASGNGSNFQVLIDRVRSGALDVRLELLVSDKPQSRAVARAREAGIDTFVFSPKDYPSREAYETEILAELNRRGIDLVVLAGYMRLLTNVLVEPYYGRMINLHPALLPSFKGARAVADALRCGVKVTGCTVHFVSLEMDSGPIIAQQAVEVREDDSEETLAARIHAAEHELLPRAVQLIREGRVRIEGNRTVIR